MRRKVANPKTDKEPIEQETKDAEGVQAFDVGDFLAQLLTHNNKTSLLQFTLGTTQKTVDAVKLLAVMLEVDGL